MRTVAALLLFWLLPIASASNQHDHFYDFFPTDAIADAYEKALGKNLDQVPFADASFRDGATHSIETLTGIFGKEAAAALAASEKIAPLSPALETWLGAQSFGQLARKLSVPLHTPPAQVLRQFFEFGPQNGRNFGSFIEIEHVRRGLMVGLLEKDRAKYTEFLVAMAESTARRIPVANRRVLALSVASELFDGPSLTALRQVLERNGSLVEFYLSYPRYHLQEPEADFQARLSALERALKEGWAHGFDLTGSIYEKSEPANPQLKALYSRRLLDVAKVVGAAHGVFKLHSFEATDEGPFYDAFWTVLEGIAALPPDQRPSRVVVGHLGALSHADISRLAALNRTAGLPLAFDGTFTSDELLHGFSTQHLVDTMLELHQAGFEVALGADGLGVLGGHDLAEAKEIFRSHLPPDVFDGLWASVERASMTARAAVPPCGKLTAEFR